MELITVRNSSCGKVMFSQVCVKNFVHGGVHGEGGHAWQRGVCGKGGHETATAANGTYPTGMHSC